jgi:predicted nucleic acid-binding protein
VSLGQPIALDACVLLNLVASGRPLQEFAATAGVTFMVVVQAEREVVWLDPKDPKDAREEIDVDLLVAGGDLQRLVMADDELVRFVALARELDDGEAATLAVAESRRLAVATDDRKARRILTTLNPQPAVTTTAAIVRAWAAGRTEEEIRACIRLIERRASFVPPRSDPDSDWWRSVVR